MVLKNCAICGKEFEAWNCKGLYCSHECKKEADRRSRFLCTERKRKDLLEAGPKITVCPCCGKQFGQYDWQHKKIYCSAECRKKHYKETAAEFIKNEPAPKPVQRKKKNQTSTLNENANNAILAGMSYGQWKMLTIEQQDELIGKWKKGYKTWK